MIACPRCDAPAAVSHAACGRCGFSLQALITAFGADLIQLQRLTDDAHCLRLQEAQDLEGLLEAFERRFPQVFITAYFGVLPASLSVGELAFLLLNRGVFASGEGSRLNEHAIAFVVDPVTRQAGLMAGYALESWFPARLLRKILGKIRTPLWHGEYVNATASVLRSVEARLRKFASRDQRRQMLPPLSAEEFMASSGFQSLRSAPSPTVGGEAEAAKDDEDQPRSDRDNSQAT